MPTVCHHHQETWVVVSNMFHFLPLLGDDFQFDQYFQMGWFNHQLETHVESISNMGLIVLFVKGRPSVLETNMFFKFLVELFDGLLVSWSLILFYDILQRSMSERLVVKNRLLYRYAIVCFLFPDFV